MKYLIIGFLLIASIITNPSIDIHRDAIKKKIFTNIESENNTDKDSFRKLGEKIGESIGSTIIDNMIERENYILFSLANVKSLTSSEEKSKTITLGIFGQIIFINKYNYNARSFDDNVNVKSLTKDVLIYDPVSKEYHSKDQSEIKPKKNNEIISDYSDKYLNSDKYITGEPIRIGNSDPQLNSDKYIIGEPIRIGNFEVAQHDFPNQMNCINANEACTKLGEGWRLPNIDELNQLYLNKNIVGSFTDKGYWSSSVKSDTIFWLQYFNLGTTFASYKSLTYNIRAIRTIKKN